MQARHARVHWHLIGSKNMSQFTKSWRKVGLKLKRKQKKQVDPCSYWNIGHQRVGFWSGSIVTRTRTDTGFLAQHRNCCFSGFLLILLTRDCRGWPHPIALAHALRNCRAIPRPTERGRRRSRRSTRREPPCPNSSTCKLGKSKQPRTRLYGHNMLQTTQRSVIT